MVLSLPFRNERILCGCGPREAHRRLNCVHKLSDESRPLCDFLSRDRSGRIPLTRLMRLLCRPRSRIKESRSSVHHNDETPSLLWRWWRGRAYANPPTDRTHVPPAANGNRSLYSTRSFLSFPTPRCTRLDAGETVLAGYSITFAAAAGRSYQLYIARYHIWRSVHFSVALAGPMGCFDDSDQ
jgi:hypothetical protein